MNRKKNISLARTSQLCPFAQSEEVVIGPNQNRSETWLLFEQLGKVSRYGKNDILFIDSTWTNSPGVITAVTGIYCHHDIAHTHQRLLGFLDLNFLGSILVIEIYHQAIAILHDRLQDKAAGLDFLREIENNPDISAIIATRGADIVEAGALEVEFPEVDTQFSRLDVDDQPVRIGQCENLVVNRLAQVENNPGTLRRGSDTNPINFGNSGQQLTRLQQQECDQQCFPASKC